MAADLESEENCCRSKERVCGSQWPSAAIPIVTSSDIIPFVSRSLIKHAGIFPCSLFSILHYGGSQVTYLEQLVRQR